MISEKKVKLEQDQASNSTTSALEDAANAHLPFIVTGACGWSLGKPHLNHQRDHNSCNVHATEYHSCINSMIYWCILGCVDNLTDHAKLNAESV